MDRQTRRDLSPRIEILPDEPMDHTIHARFGRIPATHQFISSTHIHMSARLFEGDIMFLQRMLKSSGMKIKKLDGVWGSNTSDGLAAFEARARALADQLGTFDPRTEANIMTLNLKAQEAARKFMRRELDAGYTVRIISGTRTYEEQNALYRIGRGKTDKRSPVTNARGGQSNHNFAIAWDIGIFDKKGRYLPESPLYKKITSASIAEGLEWGGSWKKFPDQPHYQLATGLAIKAVREKFENGEAYV
jgi:peptidoglycan L-alanyl-D-glutamate endopeptidase CwlK